MYAKCVYCKNYSLIGINMNDKTKIREKIGFENCQSVSDSAKQINTILNLKLFSTKLPQNKNAEADDLTNLFKNLIEKISRKV